MFSKEVFAQEMEANTSEIIFLDNDCLMNDFISDLSAELTIPFHLGEDTKTEGETESFDTLETLFYDEPIKENWKENSYFSFTGNYENTVAVKDEINNDIDIFFENNQETTYSTSGFSGSGSGSECSSTEFWTTKIELDTPPVTPPDDKISSDNIFLLASEGLKFVPLSKEEILHENVLNAKYNENINNKKKLRIQPKPTAATVRISESQPLDLQSVICNVFSDVNSNTLKTCENALSSKIFTNCNYKSKKSFLNNKDLEILQAKRKQERMIRNRESAYLSRKRKKEHVAHLEKQVQDLKSENQQLKMENSYLKQRLAKYGDMEPLIGKKPKNLFSHSTKKTTTVLALLFTVCLNFGSFSSLMNDKKVFKSNDLVSKNLVPDYSSELRHTRSLLWADNDLGSINSTYISLNKTSCPVLVNQSESIRLESELRRWIGGDEDYSRQPKHNISKINQYFYLGERPLNHKNLLKKKQRKEKSTYQKEKLEMNMYQMNILNFDTLFEAIHRRDDTFYLVSFSSNHLLLPALSHNQTSRPKMSLMLPAFLSNGKTLSIANWSIKEPENKKIDNTAADQVEMMQIDCEVTNTQVLSVNENDIPSHMRPYSNSTSRSKNKNKRKAKNFEEFFVGDLPVSLVPAKKIKLKADNMSFTKPPNETVRVFQNSGSSSKTNQLDVFRFHQPQLNLSSTQNNYKFNSDKNLKILGLNEPSKTLVNESYKQDQTIDDLLSDSRKNLLKLILVGHTITDSKSTKFNSGKLTP